MFRFSALAVLLLGSTAMPAMAQNSKQLAVSAAQAIRLDHSRPTRIPLKQAGNARLSAPVGGKQTYLVLKNIFADAPPGVSYDAYLDLPEGEAPPGRDDQHYVGTFHFFDTSPDHPREVRLNITDQMMRLSANRKLTAMPTLTVTPGAATKEEPQVGSVAIEEE